MTKVAIKNDNITFFGGIYHIKDVFLNWVLKNLLAISYPCSQIRCKVFLKAGLRLFPQLDFHWRVIW